MRHFIRFIKTFFGILLGVLGITWAIIAITDRIFSMLVGTVVCLALAFLLLRKTKADKEKHTACKNTTAAGPIKIITEYVPSPVPKDTAKDMRRCYNFMQAKRDAEIMAESFKLASSTLAMDVFCMRYGLAMRKAHTLLQAEQVGVKGIKKLNCHDACVSVIDAAQSLKLRMLADYEQNSFSQAEMLKTEKGRLNRYLNIRQTLTKAEPTFATMEEYETLMVKVDNRITSLGGAVQ